MEQPAAELLMKQPIFPGRFQGGGILFVVVRRVGCTELHKFGEDIGLSNKISFFICCCVSKPERLRGYWVVENRGQILQFFTSVKIRGGVCEMYESIFRSTPMTKPLNMYF